MRQQYIRKFVRLSSEELLAESVSSILGEAVLEADGMELGAAEIKALVAKRSAATKLSEDLREQYLKAVQAERATLAETARQLKLARDALLLRYRSSPDVLAKMGLAPPKKRKPLDAEAKAAMVAKGQATRKRRNAPPPNVDGVNGSHGDT